MVNGPVEFHVEPTDTARQVAGANGLNLRFKQRLPSNAKKTTLAFILLSAIAVATTVYSTRLLGSYFPLLLLFMFFGTFEFFAVGDKRFWVRNPEALEGKGILLAFIVVPLVIMYFAIPTVNNLVLNRFPMIVDLTLIALGGGAGIFFYLQGRASRFTVAIVSLSGFLWVLFLRGLSTASTPSLSFFLFSFVGVGLAYCLTKSIWKIQKEYSSTTADETSVSPNEKLTNLRSTGSVLFSLMVFGTILFFFADGSINTLVRAAVFYLLVFLVAIVAVCFLAGMNTKARALKAFAFISEALVVWHMYRPHPSAAGVYRPSPPFNHFIVRRGFFVVTILVFAASILPAACYLPLTIVKAQPWIDAGQAGFQDLTNMDQEEVFFEQRDEPQMTKDELVQFLNSQPEAWSFIAFEGAVSGRFFFVLTFALAGVLSVLVPLLLCCGTIALIVAPEVVRELVARENNPELYDQGIDEKTSWDEIVSAIQSSDDDIERNSVLLGFHSEAGYPILLPRETLKEHGHILGDSGSGKTALGFAPLLTQLIRMAGRDKCELKNPTQGLSVPIQSSVVVIDLKGDPALFHGVRIEAEKAGLPFRFFSNQNNHATHIFNPFLQTHLPFVKGQGTKLSRTQWVEKITECLDLYHGEGYGRGHFSELNKSIINGLLETFPDIRSFSGLDEYARPDKRALLPKKLGITSSKIEQASSAFAAIDRVAKILPLNVEPGDARFSKDVLQRRINMPSVFDSQAVIYFHLRSALEPANASTIGKLAMHSLLTAAACRSPADIQNKQVFLFVDEFQQVASESLSIVLKQARSMNISTVLSHQTLSDLKRTDFDLT